MTSIEQRAGAEIPGRPADAISIGSLLRRPEIGSLLGLVIVYTFFSIFGGINFMSGAGTASWLNVASEIGFVALPVGLLMIAGELDISVGSVIPAASMAVATVSGHFHLPILLGVVVSLGIGVLVGIINGLLVIKTAVPSLIVTLGTLFAVAGLTLGVTVLLNGSTGVAIHADPAAKAILGQFVGGKFEVTIFWWALAVAAVGYVLHFSPYGNWILAMGGDKTSARNAGIPTDRLLILLYVTSGVCAAFVGMTQAILYNSAQVSAGQSFIFNSIISVVIGGVLLTGGYGSVVGIVLGALTFSIVNQGIFYTSFNANWASLIIGILLLLAVLMNNTFRKMALSYSAKKKGTK